MSENNEKIFDSPASDPEEAFWLAHGRQMVTESLPAVRSAANALIMAVGIMEAIYMGSLGFGELGGRHHGSDLYGQPGIW